MDYRPTVLATVRRGARQALHELRAATTALADTPLTANT